MTFDIVAFVDVKSSKLISAVTLLATILPVTFKSPPIVASPPIVI